MEKSDEEDKPADFVNMGTFEFDTSFSPIKRIEYEKAKYQRGILPSLNELKKEISKNKKETKKEMEEMFKFLLQTKSNHREITFEHEPGEIYPKDIPPPGIRKIQYAEPHVLLTDLYDNQKDWYHMPKLIEGFAEESYLSYEMGFWLSSIASAINCCEYILKYEYFRHLNKTDQNKAERLSKDRYLSLGSFTHPTNNYLNELAISNFHDKILYLNDVRVSIYHFSPDRAKEINLKGQLEIEQTAPLSNDMHLPIIAFKIYNIMKDMINHFYNEKKAVEYAEEGILDWMKKRNLNKEDLKNEL